MREEDRDRVIHLAAEIEEHQRRLEREIENLLMKVGEAQERAPEMNILREARYVRDIQSRIRDMRIARKIKNEVSYLPVRKTRM